MCPLSHPSTSQHITTHHNTHTRTHHNAGAENKGTSLFDSFLSESDDDGNDDDGDDDRSSSSSSDQRWSATTGSRARVSSVRRAEQRSGTSSAASVLDTMKSRFGTATGSSSSSSSSSSRTFNSSSTISTSISTSIRRSEVQRLLSTTRARTGLGTMQSASSQAGAASSMASMSSSSFNTGAERTVPNGSSRTKVRVRVSTGTGTGTGTTDSVGSPAAALETLTSFGAAAMNTGNDHSSSFGIGVTDEIASASGELDSATAGDSSEAQVSSGFEMPSFSAFAEDQAAMASLFAGELAQQQQDLTMGSSSGGGDDGDGDDGDAMAFATTATVDLGTIGDTSALHGMEQQAARQPVRARVRTTATAAAAAAVGRRGGTASGLAKGPDVGLCRGADPHLRCDRLVQPR